MSSFFGKQFPRFLGSDSAVNTSYSVSLWSWSGQPIPQQNGVAYSILFIFCVSVVRLTAFHQYEPGRNNSLTIQTDAMLKAAVYTDILSIFGREYASNTKPRSIEGVTKTTPPLEADGVSGHWFTILKPYTKVSYNFFNLTQVILIVPKEWSKRRSLAGSLKSRRISYGYEGESELVNLYWGSFIVSKTELWKLIFDKKFKL